MARRNKHKPQIYENVEIDNIAAEGKAVTRINDLVVFVSKVVPGDIVDIKITKRKKNYKEAIPVKFHKYSELRVQPECRHFGVCGGCKWQNLSYENQLKYKQQQVVDALERIAKVEIPSINPILPSPDIYYYRNKLDFSFSDRRWLTPEEAEIPDDQKQLNGLGFHVPGMFDKVIDIEHCHLQPDPSNSIRLEIKKFALENNLSFFNLRKQHGLLRNLVIRTSSTGEIMIIVIFYEDDEQKRNLLLNFIKQRFPQITSLIYMINQKGNNTYADLEPHLFYGRNYIIEQMEGLKFKVQAKSFYQTNSKQAYNLYKVARKYASLTGNETVYDLYTGTGTIANFVAKQAKKVIGIEYIDDAVQDARENSVFNNITNTEFYSGDVKDILTQDFITRKGHPDVIILDPPRAGMHPNVVSTILFAKPNRIVYVSCNPATQARDINMLDKLYKVVKIQPVDMFPHTHHVENIVLLEKRL